jgi:hypothetical protein
VRQITFHRPQARRQIARDLDVLLNLGHILLGIDDEVGSNPVWPEQGGEEATQEGQQGQEKRNHSPYCEDSFGRETLRFYQAQERLPTARLRTGQQGEAYPSQTRIAHHIGEIEEQAAASLGEKLARRTMNAQ